MTDSLPPHTLMTTFLNDRLRERRITVEHLADLLQPIPEQEIRAWVSGSRSPKPTHLTSLAIALQLDPAELVAGWLIDNELVSDPVVRGALLDPIGSKFPSADAWDLVAPRRFPDMTVTDPHDEREPVGRRRHRIGAGRLSWTTR